MIKHHFKEFTLKVTFDNDIALNLAKLTHKIIAKNLPFLSEIFFSNIYIEWKYSFSSVMTCPKHC